MEWIQQNNDFTFIKVIEKFSNMDLEKEFNEQIKKFDKIAKMVEEIKRQLNQELQQYKNLQIEFKKQRESLFEVSFHCKQKTQYNKFSLLVYQMQELDSEYQSDQYQQIAKEINSTITEILKNDSLLVSKSEQISMNLSQLNLKQFLYLSSQQYKLNRESFAKQIMQIFQEHGEFMNNLNTFIKPSQKPEILTTEFYKKLTQKIEKDAGKIIQQINLTYLGSRDGLNGNSFWSKVNGKKNLLMIFKSNNMGNNVFGGFSPCQWYCSQNGEYVKDETCTAFIFSQTKNEICPLKQERKAYAHWFDVKYGPIFGTHNGNDLRIDLDFVKGGSALNCNYASNSSDPSHLFGNINPNVGECEIYEIQFK